MGVLTELFSEPVYGPNGQMGDVGLKKAPVMNARAGGPTAYAEPMEVPVWSHVFKNDSDMDDDTTETLLHWVRPELHNGVWVWRRARNRLGRRVAEDDWGAIAAHLGIPYDPAATASPAARREWELQLEDYQSAAWGQVAPEQLWAATGGQAGEPPPEPETRPNEVVPEDFYTYGTAAAPTPYWLQSPPGGATLNGRQYRSGQFVPGTTMFTHGGARRPQRDIRPEAPVPYKPAAYGPATYAPPDGTAPGPEGTHALPTPQGAGQAVQGAPQTVGGEPMFPSPGAAPQPPQAGPPGPGGGLGAGAPPQARPAAAGPPVVRTPGLDPQDATVEVQSQVFAQANYGTLRDLYFQTHATADPTSGDVRSLTIDPEGWKEFLPGYTGSNGRAVGNAAAWLSRTLFQEALQNQSGKGNGRMMVLAGGPGGGDRDSGVSDYLKTAEYPLVLDGAGGDYRTLEWQFEQARAAGLEPEYTYVDRPAAEALSGSVEDALRRRLNGEPARAVPLADQARAGLAARRTALEVLFRQPQVRARVVDTEAGSRFQRRLITDRAEAAHYLSQRVAEEEQFLRGGGLNQLERDVVERHKAGEIPADLVTALLGVGWNVRPPVPLQRSPLAPRR